MFNIPVSCSYLMYMLLSFIPLLSLSKLLIMASLFPASFISRTIRDRCSSFLFSVSATLGYYYYYWLLS